MSLKTVCGSRREEDSQKKHRRCPVVFGKTAIFIYFLVFPLDVGDNLNKK